VASRLSSHPHSRLHYTCRPQTRQSLEWDEQPLGAADLPDDVLAELEAEDLAEPGGPLQPLLSDWCTPRRNPPPHCRYPLWEKRVRLVGDTRLAADLVDFRPPARLEPVEVIFTSPPTVVREVIVCGFVSARLLLRSRADRRIALPFQALFPAWPVRDGDHTREDFVRFDGTRICPTLVTTPGGRTQRAVDLKVFFTAVIRVFRARPGW
jgi:hypothetical protein